MAALSAAALDQRAPVPVTHTPTKAVLTFAAALVRLICTLHDEVSLVGKVAAAPWTHGTHAF